MEESENLYDKIREIFGGFPDNLNILEETIDIDLQMEYFENSRLIKLDIDQEKTMENAGSLFDEGLSIDEIKGMLSKLASVERVEAYRIIEKYMQNPQPSLREWGILALQESRMLIESKLLDENHVFISTGLGGKGNKLRYFVVLLARDNITLNPTQRKVIKNEFRYTLNKYGGEIEEFNFSGYLATLMTVIPMDVTIKQLFDEAINECNQFGDFLVKNFIITNVKALDFDEIRNFLKKNRER